MKPEETDSNETHTKLQADARWDFQRWHKNVVTAELGCSGMMPMRC